jgi:serine/threonine protein kinase
VLKIADFGNAVLGKQNKKVLYSSGYAPADQRNGLASEQNDIYALGVILLEVLINRKIFYNDIAYLRNLFPARPD